MQEQFTAILQAFTKEGIDIHAVEYSFTPYSLNTKLSFKFDNLREFLEFLELNPGSTESEAITHKLTDSGLNPDTFFFVNFYKPKVAEI
jgi:hypothetical protein